MAEYIEREALLEVVNNLRLGRHLNKDAALNLMERAINNLPAADVVAVVRCKECKHYKPQNISVHWKHTVPYCCRGIAVKVSPNDFCSYGERRGDNAR